MKKMYLSGLSVAFFSLSSFSQNCDLICNADFDSIQYPTSNYFVDSSQMPCWKTTAPDGQFEVWGSGFNSVPSYSGFQFLELNAFFVSTVYQNITAIPGTNLAISFAHRGRAGVDTMSVSAGPVGGPYTDLGYFGDSTTAWGYYTVNYTTPNLGNNYSIRFNSIYAALNNQAIGNFLDAISVCATNVGMNEVIPNENSFSIFPNPSSDNLSLLYYSKTNDPSVSISIFNSNGALVKKVIADLIAGKNKIDLNLKALNAEIYFIKIAGNNNTSVKKWVKF